MTMSLLKEKSDSKQHKQTLQGDLVIFVGNRRLAAFLGSTGTNAPKITRHVTYKNPEGFENGLVTDLERASHSIERIVKDLAGGVISEDETLSAYVVLANSKLRTFNFSSSQYYQGSQRTITQQEIRNVIEQTRSVATLPLTESVLQAVPQSYLVNDLAGVRNPLGLEAHRLGVELKIHTMHFEDFKNISRAFETAEIEVAGFFPKTITVSEGILQDQEKEEGALLFDFAEDCTQVVLWKDGQLVDSKTFPSGVRNLCENIASEWGVGLYDAMKVQSEYGSLISGDFADELIPLVERNGKGSHAIKRADFQKKYTTYFQTWMAGLLEQAEAFSNQHKVFYPHSIFAGEAVHTDGFVEYMAQNFSRSVRIGTPRKVDAVSELLLDPAMIPALGMFRWMSQQLPDHKKITAPKGFFQKTISSAKDWFFAYF